MFAWFVLGIALLIAVVLAGQWFAITDPRLLARLAGRALLGLLVLVIGFLAITGKLGLALVTLPALLPWILRGWRAWRTAKNFTRAATGPAPGQQSEVATRFLRMVLDHETGAMIGEVTGGPQAGRALADLTVMELVALLSHYWTQDSESARVLEAFLEREHPDWRAEAAPPPGGTAAFEEGPMGRDEAFRILGLEPGADTAAIKEAHRRLMAGLHPDRGGSSYLAAKINQAKDTLLDG